MAYKILEKKQFLYASAIAVLILKNRKILKELPIFWKKPTQAQTISVSSIVGSQTQMAQAGFLCE